MDDLRQNIPTENLSNLVLDGDGMSGMLIDILWVSIE